MQKTRKLTTEERRFILNLRIQQELTVTEIADAVQRFRGTVYNIINNADKQIASAQSCKFYEEEKLWILRKTRTYKHTAR